MDKSIKIYTVKASLQHCPTLYDADTSFSAGFFLGHVSGKIKGMTGFEISCAIRTSFVHKTEDK